MVIDTAAEALAAMVTKLVARGAVGDTVVAAGGVMVRQPRLAKALGNALAARHPRMVLRILDDDPVAGAVVLARRLLTGANGPDRADRP